MNQPRVFVCAMLLAAAAWTALLAQAPPSSRTSDGAGDAPRAASAKVSTGAAPGYAEDAACASCHAEIAKSYQATGMARSFSRPGPDNVVEKFSRNRGEHKPSQKRYEMTQQGDRYVFKRYQLDADGNEINAFEQKVDWILGSGHTSRSYFYQTKDGEMYQLPIAWYAQEEIWYMAPGYDRPDHDGIGRRVLRECMFCHNAYPQVPAGTDGYGHPPMFPADMPGGIGCQRCHGPGAEHVRAASGSAAEVKRSRDTIVNPARLEAKRRDDVCNQCHLQPTVALMGVRRFGRGTYSYRPGEALSEYLVQMEIVENGKDPSERFEINHHPYRLQQSACFQRSSGALNCLTCHDPHGVVPDGKKAEHYRAACMSCHKTGELGSAHAQVSGFDAAGDCVSCHMQQRRTQDVVHVAMTDHLIRRRPGGPELLAPLTETDPSIVDVVLYDSAEGPSGETADNYRAVAVLRAAGHRHKDAHERLEKNLGAGAVREAEPYLDLANAQMVQRRFEEAGQTLERVLKLEPGNPRAEEWQGVLEIGLGRLDTAIEHFEKLLRDDPDRAEALYNYGLALVGKDRYADAAAQFARAVELRHNMAPAWYYLGYVNAKLNRLDQAVASYKRALEVQPEHTRAYVGIGQALAAAGNRAEALRYLNHGLRVASQKAPIAEELDKLARAQGRD